MAAEIVSGPENPCVIPWPPWPTKEQDEKVSRVKFLFPRKLEIGRSIHIPFGPTVLLPATWNRYPAFFSESDDFEMLPSSLITDIYHNIFDISKSKIIKSEHHADTDEPLNHFPTISNTEINNQDRKTPN